LNIRALLLVSSVILSTNSFANSKPYFATNAAIGYGHYNNATRNNGSGAVARISLDAGAQFTQNYITTGLELGIQNGNSMELKTSTANYNNLAQTKITMNIKPTVDALAFLLIHIGSSKAVVGLKSGIAYRKMTFNRDTINSLDKINAELQAQIGYQITERTTFDINYEIIFGKNPSMTTTAVNTQTNTGTVYGIPTQQAGMLGFNIQL
jgi:hypothetical protein